MSQPSASVKRLVDERDGRCCSVCGRYLPGSPGGRHHRQLRSQQPDPTLLHRPSNLIDICGTGTTGCHGWVHAHPAEAYRLGLLVRMGRDPSETPMLRYARSDRPQWVMLNDNGDITVTDPPEAA
ncbi:HNH endonuclease [Bifidobacterium sp. 82T24]|uniref:HNH endonuclease n=1 Tax=Bifidobacterium pluvialisilvae TaxID=2834436 RepID=UPI001C560E83|nr:HNH endonuclease [Bifidobacterium pluvialisilvae]MBW3088804.1 HNH endonuclease [Bifidobacterium pluvialisilvae]